MLVHATQRRLQMQYLLMIYSKEGAWERMTPAEQQQGMAAYGAFTEALKKSGALAGSNRLRPASTATTMRIANSKTQVLDGPYAESCRITGTGTSSPSVAQYCSGSIVKLQKGSRTLGTSAA